MIANCPHCQGGVDLTGIAAGLVVGCPHCGQNVQVRGRAPVDIQSQSPEKLSPFRNSELVRVIKILMLVATAVWLLVVGFILFSGFYSTLDWSAQKRWDFDNDHSKMVGYTIVVTVGMASICPTVPYALIMLILFIWLKAVSVKE